MASVGTSVRFIKIGGNLSPGIQPGMAGVWDQEGHRQRKSGVQKYAFQCFLRSAVSAVNLACIPKRFTDRARTCCNIRGAFVLAACPSICRVEGPAANFIGENRKPVGSHFACRLHWEAGAASANG